MQKCMAISTLSTIPNEEVRIMSLSAIKMATSAPNPFVRLVGLAGLFKVRCCMQAGVRGS